MIVIKVIEKIHTYFVQILGVTADNTSNNDKMIERLTELIDGFPGAANQTRCFTHILNLVAKSVLQQFEAPKAKGDTIDDAMIELEAIAGELEDDDVPADEEGDADEDNDAVDDDSDNGPDERDGMSQKQRAQLEESVKPIRLVLTKVWFKLRLNWYQLTKLQLRGISFALKNSSTIALPRWYKVLNSLNLKPQMMPRDVSTRWNSTYDMIKFATEYRAALDAMTGDRDMKLHKFELSNTD